MLFVAAIADGLAFAGLANAFDVGITRLTPLQMLLRAGVNATVGVILFELVVGASSAASGAHDLRRPPALLQRRLALVLAALLVAAIGIATIFSATHNSRFAGLYLKQVYALGLGLLALIVAASLDYRRLADRAPALFLLALGVLGACSCSGREHT